VHNATLKCRTQWLCTRPRVQVRLISYVHGIQPQQSILLTNHTVLFWPAEGPLLQHTAS